MLQQPSPTTTPSTPGQRISRHRPTPNPFRYIGTFGYYADGESGLMLLGVRYYDQRLGLFIGRGPSRLDDNEYLYATSNPVMLYDPNGLKCKPIGQPEVHVKGQHVGARRKWPGLAADVLIYKTVKIKQLVACCCGQVPEGRFLQERNGFVYANGRPLPFPDGVPGDTHGQWQEDFFRDFSCFDVNQCYKDKALAAELGCGFNECTGKVQKVYAYTWDSPGIADVSWTGCSQPRADWKGSFPRGDFPIYGALSFRVMAFVEQLQYHTPYTYWHFDFHQDWP